MKVNLITQILLNPYSLLLYLTSHLYNHLLPTSLTPSSYHLTYFHQIQSLHLHLNSLFPLPCPSKVNLYWMNLSTAQPPTFQCSCSFNPKWISQYPQRRTKASRKIVYLTLWILLQCPQREECKRTYHGAFYDINTLIWNLSHYKDGTTWVSDIQST